MQPPKNKKVCECCSGTYSTGKEYGDYWFQYAEKEVITSGLCQFCNVNNKSWFTSLMPQCENHKHVMNLLHGSNHQLTA